MPYWDEARQKWRAHVKHLGQRYRQDFDTKKEAVAWEREILEKLQKDSEAQTTRTDMDLVSFFNRYMDHAEIRFVRKVFVEKKSLCLRFLEMSGNMPVGQVTSAMVEAYLSKYPCA